MSAQSGPVRPLIGDLGVGRRPRLASTARSGATIERGTARGAHTEWARRRIQPPGQRSRAERKGTMHFARLRWMVATALVTTTIASPVSAAPAGSAVRDWNLHATNALFNLPTAMPPGAGQGPSCRRCWTRSRSSPDVTPETRSGPSHYGRGPIDVSAKVEVPVSRVSGARPAGRGVSSCRTDVPWESGGWSAHGTMRQ